MKFGSVCSGIEAASVAWESFGWKASWFAEIDKFASELLSQKYPDVVNHGDMTLLVDKILSGDIEAPDVFCGGTPCQAFSYAGLRKSLDDHRANLSLTFCEIADAIDHVRSIRNQQPSIIFYENVPGILNTKDNAFGSLLAGLAGESSALQPPRGKWTNSGVVVGPKRTIAWRILDAQHFGLAQRRKRVFLVASARADTSPIEILFEFGGLRRDIAPSRTTRESITIKSCSSNESADQPYAIQGNLIGRTNGGPCGVGVSDAGTMYTLTRTDVHAVVYALPGNWVGRKPENGGNATEPCVNISPCLTRTDVHAVVVSDNKDHHVARKITPLECERLMGFPDNYTDIQGSKPTHRYKVLGNSWAVPVVRWIGDRINKSINQQKETQ